MSPEKLTWNDFKARPAYSMLLALTLFYFLYKGLVYLMIGSWVPLALIVCVMTVLAWGFRTSNRAFRRAVVFWAVLLILWSGTRLLLTVVNAFVKPIPEGHVANQLGVMGTILALAMLTGAIYLIRRRKQF